MSDFKTIRLERRPPLGLITIDRPEKHNAISLQVLDELNRAFDLLASEDAIRVISFLGGRWPCFCCGIRFE